MQGNAGLVAKWHFDEGAGCVLVDSSRNGDNGVIHGASMPGFVVVVAIMGLLAVYMRRERI